MPAKVTAPENTLKAPAALKDAYQAGDLALYLGAGVSVPSGLPNWEQLVLMLYFKTLDADLSYKVYPNYLLAISEWLLQKKKDPLDVVVRKIKRVWKDNQLFYTQLKDTLYSTYLTEGFLQRPMSLLFGNKTLKGVADLCKGSIAGKKGVSAIISYNYDDLLELAIDEAHATQGFEPIWKSGQMFEEGQIPIYHVHGYIPHDQEQFSGLDEFVFSEEQYNNAYQDAFFWGNMIQMQCLSSKVGLMIGTSLADRNVRRILDAVKRSPVRSRNYLLLRRPERFLPDQNELTWIADKAHKNFTKVRNSGIKQEEKEVPRILEAITGINQFESSDFDNIYSDLGLTIIWYDDHDEVPGFIESIVE